MTLVVDMNLSPSWIARLAQRGVEAVHWSTIGAATALDDEILSWVRERRFVLLTNDLDFSAILASTADRAPSVIQLRGQDLLSEAMADAVTRALSTYRDELAQGALLSINENGARVRILPLSG